MYGVCVDGPSVRVKLGLDEGFIGTAGIPQWHGDCDGDAAELRDRGLEETECSG